LALGAGAGVERCPPGNAMEPARQLLPPRDRRGFPRQNEEGGLKSILGRVPVPQYAAAHAQDHCSMPIHQGRERSLCGLTLTRDEALEQLLVVQRPGRAAMVKRVQVPQYLMRPRAWHRLVSRTLEFNKPILVVERLARPFFC
jgi:hypothetical protein